MGVWVMIVVASVGVPSAGVMWWWGRRRVARLRSVRLDGDQCEAKEMLVAFGATQEWV